MYFRISNWNFKFQTRYCLLSAILKLYISATRNTFQVSNLRLNCTAGNSHIPIPGFVWRQLQKMEESFEDGIMGKSFCQGIEHYGKIYWGIFILEWGESTQWFHFPSMMKEVQTQMIELRNPFLLLWQQQQQFVPQHCEKIPNQNSSRTFVLFSPLHFATNFPFPTFYTIEKLASD